MALREHEHVVECITWAPDTATAAIAEAVDDGAQRTRFIHFNHLSFLQIRRQRSMAGRSREGRRNWARFSCRVRGIRRSNSGTLTRACVSSLWFVLFISQIDSYVI